MKVTKQIEVYLLRKRNIRPVDVVQYDTGVELVFSVKDFVIPGGTTATLYVQKPSGKFVYQEKNITVASDTVTVDLENQAITEYGRVGYQVTLKNGSDTVTTFAGLMNVEKSLKDSGVETERMVEVEWEGQSNASYEADIQIIAYDRSGLFAEFSLMLASIDVPLVAISAHQSKSKQGTCTINLSIIIKNTQQLEKIIRDLAKWPDVIEVFRVVQ